MDSILYYLANNYPTPSQVVTRDHEVQFEELEKGHCLLKLVTVCYTDVLYYPWVKETTFIEEPKKIPIECVNTKTLLVMFQKVRPETKGLRPFAYIKYKIYDISDPSFNPDEVLRSICKFMSKENVIE